MSWIRNVVRQLEDVELEDEECESLCVVLNTGVSTEALACYERKIGAALPHDLRELLRVTDGMDFFGLDIMDLESLEFHQGQRIVAFHNWGNGDFDCVALRDAPYPEGSVVFMSHSPDVVVPVATSLVKWLGQVVAEIRERGTLLHPSDYHELRSEREGVYRDAARQLGKFGETFRPPRTTDFEEAPMGISKECVAELLADPSVRLIDDAVAARVKLPVYRESPAALTDSLREELETAGIAPGIIREMLKSRKDDVIEFGVALVLDEQPDSNGDDSCEVEDEALGAGYALTCAIYMNFLEGAAPKQLEDYLRRRRIPDWRSFAGQLRRVWERVTSQ